MSVETFGTMPGGQPVHSISLGRAPGLELQILTLGATVRRLLTTCGDGTRRNIVLGHATVGDYLESGDYIGGTIGRYANRIAGGSFRLGSREITVGAHDRGNHLHGGPDGFDRRLWDLINHSEQHATLGLTSPDGDQGFPGELHATVRFQVDGDCVLMDFTATTDAPTVVNMTSHAYFNLDGDGAGTIDDHELLVNADLYTPTDSTGVPRGSHASVSHTPFDLRELTPIGPVVRSSHPHIGIGRGIDHNYVISGSGFRSAALLRSPRTSTQLEVRTDQPGLQVYTGNFLDGSRLSSHGVRYRQGDGIALEPQLFPDTPNRPDFGSAELLPSQTYRARAMWQLGPGRT